MRQFTTFFLGIILCLVLESKGQISTNTVRFQVTYEAIQGQYTVWVVPDYNTPNEWNSDSLEKGPTAQVTLRVPKDFVLNSVENVRGEWDTSPLKLGPNEPNQPFFSGLNPSYRYYVIGKSPVETIYGRFQKGKPVALFRFKGNGCFGAVSVVDETDPFVAVAEAKAALKVRSSFYSRSGQRNFVNAVPLEQFTFAIAPPAYCCNSAVNFSGTITFPDERSEFCKDEKVNINLKNIKGITNQSVKFVISSTEPINETEAYSPDLRWLGTVSNVSLSNNRSEASLSNVTLPSSVGRYFVIALLEDGTALTACKPFTSVGITVNASPIVKIVADRTGFVCKGDAVTMKATPANQHKYEWFLGNSLIAGATSDTYQTAISGTYTVKITSRGGCSALSEGSSFSTLVVAQPTIKQTGERLSSSSRTGNQWYFNEVAINGANDSIYVPRSPGKYTVQTTTSSCKSPMSEPFYFAVTAVEVAEESLILYPNPTKKDVNLRVANEARISVRCYDLRGNFLPLQTSREVNILRINTSDLPVGSYLLWIEKDTKQSVYRLIKQ